MVYKSDNSVHRHLNSISETTGSNWKMYLFSLSSCNNLFLKV